MSFKSKRGEAVFVHRGFHNHAKGVAVQVECPQIIERIAHDGVSIEIDNAIHILRKKARHNESG